MRKSTLTLITVFLVFTLVLSVRLASADLTIGACTVDEVNDLLDAYEIAAKNKDAVALDNLLAANFQYVIAQGHYTPPVTLVWDRAYYINWQQVYQPYQQFMLYNREIKSSPDYPYIPNYPTATLVNADLYTVGAYGLVIPGRDMLTLIRENGDCVILMRVELQHGGDSN